MEQIGGKQRRTTAAEIGIGERDIDVVHIVVPSHRVTDDAVDRPATKPQRPRERPPQARDVGKVTDAADQHVGNLTGKSIDETSTRRTHVAERGESNGVVGADHDDSDVGTRRDQRIELLAHEVGHTCATDGEGLQLEAPLVRAGKAAQGLTQPHVARVVEPRPGERAVAGGCDPHDTVAWITLGARGIRADDRREVTPARGVERLPPENRAGADQ